MVSGSACASCCPRSCVRWPQVLSESLGGPLCPSLLQGSVMEQGWGPCGSLPPAAMGGWSGQQAGSRAGGGELGDQGSGGCWARPAHRKLVISHRAPLGSQHRTSHCLTEPQPSGLGGPQDKGCMVVKKCLSLFPVCVFKIYRTSSMLKKKKIMFLHVTSFYCGIMYPKYPPTP